MAPTEEIEPMDTMRMLARRGAEVRVVQLQGEIADLLRKFPGINGESKSGNGRVGRPRKKRPFMSAKARKAIGDAQRRRWAKLRAEQRAAGK
jgi:hypothetical protein